jgi:diacylglycerol kinase family enzyme
MLSALLLANAGSGSADKVKDVSIPGRWIRDPAAVTLEDVRGADLIALFGGDGTMQMTLSQILRELPIGELPPVAVLPFGTTNMNARALNRARSRRACVESLNRVIQSGSLPIEQRSLVRADNGQVPEYGFFFGLGVIAEVVERWNQNRKQGALANQLKSLWAMIAGLRSVSSATLLTIDGELSSVYGLLGSTLDRLLFGSRPYWGDGKSGDLRLTWIDADAPDLFRHAPDILRGKAHMTAVQGYHSRPADQVQLGFTGPYILDGEIFHSTGRSLTIARTEPISWITL